MPLQKLTDEERKQRRRQRDAEYYARNKERVKAAAAVWRVANPERKKANDAAWVAANLEKHRQHQREYVARNREHLLEKQREYHHRNREARAERGSAWLRANPDKARAACARWRAKNVELRRIIERNRKAKKRAADGVLSRGIVQRLLLSQKGLCACCGKPLGTDYHLDHIMPIALGGANSDWNVQLLLGKCNLQKGAKHPDVFKRMREVECHSRN
jgi:5-methylcytosine-specific restriction endonuclease McrA